MAGGYNVHHDKEHRPQKRIGTAKKVKEGIMEAQKMSSPPFDSVVRDVSKQREAVICQKHLSHIDYKSLTF